MTKYICDRCGREVEQYLHLSHIVTDSKEHEFRTGRRDPDLCKKCTREIMNMVNEKLPKEG